MSKTYYLKNIRVLLKDTSAAVGFRVWARKWKALDIDLYMFIVGKDRQQQMVPEKILSAERSLYITDSNKVAAELCERNFPVLGVLHKEGDALTNLEYVMECPEELDVEYLERVYRRYQGIPWEIQETERCIIRETTLEDVESFFEIYDSPEITRYTEGLHTEQEQERAYIQDYIDKAYRYYEFGTWTVILKETGEIIGRAGFAVREDYELPDLGFVIGVPWQRKGVAYEICSAILQYGKEELGFEQVQALVMPENEASLALCRKLGFTERRTVTKNHQNVLLLVKRLT
uniref:GNAT family N-acetyltransferase n=1 Tax=Acetatifactor sp. TaxID=1872090 RepID=UPI004057C907